MLADGGDNLLREETNNSVERDKILEQSSNPRRRLAMADKWQDKDLGLMIRLLNPYSTDMKQPTEDIQAEGAAAQPTSEALPADLGQYHVEIDNYEGTWDFSTPSCSGDR
jgi:hypothetical protein